MDQNNPITLESLDLFQLLRLSHLSDEEKTNYSNQLLEIAFSSMLVDDLPLYLTQEEITEFTSMTERPENQQKAMEFLQAKVPKMNELLKDKLLILKESLVKANIDERLEINKTEYDHLRSQADSPETATKLLKNQKERTNLEQTLQAITGQNWRHVNQLITSV